VSAIPLYIHVSSRPDRALSLSVSCTSCSVFSIVSNPALRLRLRACVCVLACTLSPSEFFLELNSNCYIFRRRTCLCHLSVPCFSLSRPVFRVLLFVRCLCRSPSPRPVSTLVFRLSSVLLCPTHPLARPSYVLRVSLQHAQPPPFASTYPTHHRTSNPRPSRAWHPFPHSTPSAPATSIMLMSKRYHDVAPLSSLCMPTQRT